MLRQNFLYFSLCHYLVQSLTPIMKAGSIFSVFSPQIFIYINKISVKSFLQVDQTQFIQPFFILEVLQLNIILINPSFTGELVVKISRKQKVHSRGHVQQSFMSQLKYRWEMPFVSLQSCRHRYPGTPQCLKYQIQLTRDGLFYRDIQFCDFSNVIPIMNNCVVKEFHLEQIS